MLSAKSWKFYQSILRPNFFLKNVQARTLLSEAYSCDDIWEKQLLKPPFQGLKMDQYFIEVDKKFNTKRLASGVDIDIFANSVADSSQLDELEHLLFRFRRTKRAVEMMDSTHYAVVKAYLRFKDYEALFRILSERESYGVFPDFYSYNMLMHTFLKGQNYRDAAEIAVLMMWQEDFSNAISRILGLYSCYEFLEKCSLDSFWQRNEANKDNEENESKEEGEDNDEEDTYIRVPYLRNPWFDDHFDISEPKHLIGKTLYLIGREEDNVLGRTSQILGLCMYEKWDKALKVLDTISEKSPALLQDGVLKCKELVLAIPDENEEKNKIGQLFEEKIAALQNSGKISSSTIMNECENELERIQTQELNDIKEQISLFSEWEKSRQQALNEQEKDVDKEKRLKVIAEKKEELYWKEKLLFFFENEENVMNEYEKVQNIIQELKNKEVAEGAYTPPEILRKAPIKISNLRRRALIKSLQPDAKHKFKNE